MKEEKERERWVKRALGTPSRNIRNGSILGHSVYKGSEDQADAPDNAPYVNDPDVSTRAELNPLRIPNGVVRITGT